MAYGSDAAMTAYLALTGRVVHPSHTVPIAREWGSIYVNQFEQDYRGAAVTTDASFPRDMWPVVPTSVENAVYEAGYSWSHNVPIFGAGGSAGGQVTSEKLDGVGQLTYADPQAGTGYWENNRFILPTAYTLLLPFLKRKGGFYPAALVV